MRYVVAVVVATAFLFYGTASARNFSAAGHGCAPPVPPGVPGSPVPAPAEAGAVVINEILTTPQTTWNCSESSTEFLSYDAWVELYNPLDQPLDLYSVHAYLDSGPSTNPYYLPFGSAIAPHGFLVLFPDQDEHFVATLTSTLRLLIAGVTIDQVSCPSLPADQSYARVPDGTGTWQIASAPTIDASNTVSQGGTNPPPTPHRGRRSRGRGLADAPGGPGFTGAASGTQPSWSSVHVPASPGTAPHLAGTAAQPSLPRSSSIIDVPRVMVLGTLAAALLSALLWCWRLFKGSPVSLHTDEQDPARP